VPSGPFAGAEDGNDSAFGPDGGSKVIAPSQLPFPFVSLKASARLRKRRLR